MGGYATPVWCSYLTLPLPLRAHHQISCLGVLIATTFFFGWQAGYLESVVDSFISKTGTSDNSTNSSTSFATAFGDGATTGMQFLETYDSFGDTDATAAESNNTIWVIAFWVMCVLSVIYLVLLCILRSHIRLAIALIKETGCTLRKMKFLLFYPFFTYSIVAVVTVYWLAI